MRSLIPASVAMLLSGIATAQPPATPGTGSEVTFSKEVVRILQESCQSCHRPGGIAPMSFLTYDEVRPWAKSIRRVVLERTMPPWHADSEPGRFLNDSSLTPEEIATLVAWVNRGAPQGDPQELPPRRTFEAGWRLGAPDLVYQPAAAYTVPGDVDDEYRCFVVPSHLEHDAWYRGVEYRPKNPRVVHHLIVFVDSTERSLQRQQESPDPGFTCGMGSGVFGLDMLGGWAPGQQPAPVAGGSSRLLKKGSHLVFQMHYHNTTGEAQSDQSQIGIFLQRDTVDKVGHGGLVSAWELNIAAGDPHAEHRATWTAPEDISIVLLQPHMHYLGKAMTVTAHYSDGRDETLLSVPRYDFDWQTSYELAEPWPIPRGTILEMVAVHDNSADNPNNPSDPPQDVHWGEASDEEMAIAFFGYLKDNEKVSIEPTPPDVVAAAVFRAQRREPSGGR